MDLLQHQPNLKDAIDAEARQRLVEIFDEAAGRRKQFRRWNRYYYRELVRLMGFTIPRGKRILEVGCGDGFLLRELRPSFGLGIDISPRMIDLARASAAPGEADLRFEVGDIESVRFGETFDYVIMSDLLGNLLDVQQALENVRSACHEGTRLIVNYHDMLWEPLLRLVARIGLKMPNRHHNWIANSDIRHFLNLADFEVVTHQRRLLMPKGLLGLGWVLNRLVARLPLVNSLCLVHLLVLRRKERPPAVHRSVTIVIPCRNEKGNIRAAVERIPPFGTRQEILFVDGHSTDGTVEEIQRVIADFPGKDIKLLVQEGRGKGDAVRLGFARATGDVLMILDADLTMPPEDLPKFYDAIATGKGEFINGSRLVYPMERQAMRLLNMLGNKFFSVSLSAILGQPLKDTLCGTKVLRKEDYQKIAENRGYFGDFDPFGDFDLLFGASRLKLRIAEVPIRYRDRTYGQTNISRFRHGWLLLKMTLFALRKLI
jgi:SAM-dependent methyltransferase